MKITKRLKKIIKEATASWEQRDSDRYDTDDHGWPQHSMGSATGLAQAMQDAWLPSGMSPEDWVAEQDGVWVEAVVAEYMDKVNAPPDMSTTDPAMETMREEATQIFLVGDDLK